MGRWPGEFRFGFDGSFAQAVCDCNLLGCCTFGMVIQQRDDAPIKWIQMVPDKAIGKVKENHQAGVIGVKLFIYEMNRKGTRWDPEIGEEVPYEAEFDPSRNMTWKLLIKPMLRLPIWKVRAYIFQCRDLPAADSDGTSDPCIRIHGDGTKGRDIEPQTAVIEDNMNPLFYQALEITVESISKDKVD